MRKFLTVLIVFLATLKLSSQPTGSINIPIKDALKVLAAADSAKIHKVHISILKSDIELLGQRITALQQAKDLYQQADSISQADLTLCSRQITLLEDQKKIAQGYITGLEKLYKKQKRKTRITAIAGIITTSAALFLYFSK